MDILEVITLFTGGGSDAAGLVDIFIAGIGNLVSGDMWINGRPDPNLPPMFLIGQDVLWTAGADYAVPWGMFGAATAATGNPEAGVGVKMVTDLCTSIASIVYDWGRAEGSPTRLNAGVSIEGQPYILFYPRPK